MRRDLLPVGLMLGVALVLTLGSASTSQDHALHDGTVVSAAFGKLVLLEHDGKEATYLVPDTVMITIMGKDAKLTDLKKGLQVQVTLGKGGEVAAITTVEPHKYAVDWDRIPSWR